MADLIYSFKNISDLNEGELFITELAGITTPLYIFEGSNQGKFYATGRYDLQVKVWSQNLRVVSIQVCENMHETIEFDVFRNLL